MSTCTVARSKNAADAWAIIAMAKLLIGSPESSVRVVVAPISPSGARSSSSGHSSSKVPPSARFEVRCTGRPSAYARSPGMPRRPRWHRPSDSPSIDSTG
ncbi:hypothetical protein WEH80_31015 [Actinomycetes bacterium KLBMP 9759]